MWLIGAVQFVNVLDFMMVMPLGPDLGASLGIPVSRIGYIAGSYTAAAAVAGIVGSVFLDRFGRRTALVYSLVGLALGTLAGGLSVGFTSLLASRLLAGMFGGPATAIGIAILADVVPPERRGLAMGKVMGAFAIASVLGVPLGLESARLFGFRAPFFGVAALAITAAAMAFTIMPELRDHLTAERRAESKSASIMEPTIILSLLSSACIMAGNFALIPNLSAYMQFNLGYPREKLGFVYATGGALSFLMMRITGRLVDRFGAAQMILVGSVAYSAVVSAVFFVPAVAAFPLLAFAAFMTSNSIRFVPVQSLGSRVPTANRRARFLSAQSSVQHMASTIGSVGASAFLVALPDGRLVGLDQVAIVTLCLSVVVPFFGYAIERRVREREASERAAFALNAAA